MVKVEARKGESGEKLLQRFKRLVNKDGILKEWKKKSRYEKPSEKRRRKEKERIKNLRKAERNKKEGFDVRKGHNQRPQRRTDDS